MSDVKLDPKDPKDLAILGAAGAVSAYAIADNIKARRKKNEAARKLAAASKHIDEVVERTRQFRERAGNQITKGSEIASNVHKMGEQIKRSALEHHRDNKPSPKPANQNVRNMGNLRSMKPAPVPDSLLTPKQFAEKKVQGLTRSAAAGQVLIDKAFIPTKRNIEADIDALKKSRYTKKADLPQSANQNRVRTMGRGGGGGIYDPSGMIGKAVEKFFKKV